MNDTLRRNVALLSKQSEQEVSMPHHTRARQAMLRMICLGLFMMIVS